MTKSIPVASDTVPEDPRWSLLKQKANIAKAAKAFGLFRARDIEPILIKGLAAALFYPKDRFRDSIDLDLAVAAAHFETAQEIVLSADAKGLAVDLHCELRHLDTLEWDDLFANSESIDMDGAGIRVLRPEDHLRVLCVHWLTDGGANEDRLWDIYYLVANRRPDFDWDRFLSVVDARRQRWLTCTLGIAQRKLGLDLDATPVANAAAELPRWFERTIEKEWASDTRFRPLHDSTENLIQFWKQLKKRLPPNPITATVLMNGSFDAPTRIFYQIGTTLKRMGPSFTKTSKAIIRSVKKNG